jgi:hypothetical protein
MTDDVTRILSGLYIAMTAAMPKESAVLADNVLLNLLKTLGFDRRTNAFIV